MLIKRINNESGVIANTPIKDNASPFITIEQLEGVLNHTKKQREVWDYIAKLIEIDHERIDYLDYEKQNELT